MTQDPPLQRLTAPFKVQDEGRTVWRIEYIEGWQHYETRAEARRAAKANPLVPVAKEPHP